MTRPVRRALGVMRRTSVAARLAALAALVIFCAVMSGVTVAHADRDTPQFHRGACKGAYPGWLRGVADAYNGLATLPIENGTLILTRVPTPESLAMGDERLGWGDGLMEGFKLGVAYGVELAKAARAPESNADKMKNATDAFGAYLQMHCGKHPAALDWNTTVMDNKGNATVTSLNEAQLAMHLASSANQLAISAEKLALGAQDAEAKGDHPAAMTFRASAKGSAHLAASFADMAQSHAAGGREEAVQAIIDAKAAAERAKKAADNAGG